ncbi:uncharacterized protein [Hetaerina americana]|uniref:uncharacterized protein n=1 Tax=Hetaerina americana TaxID=62018 RepID=UPI003A7F3EBA
MVNHLKMKTAALLAVLLLSLLPDSPAQNVRAVDHYISDPAPVAGIGVGEVVPATAPKRVGMPPRAPQVPSRQSSPPHISRETEHTISYVEDVLAGRIDVSQGARDAVFEQGGRAEVERPKPLTSTEYSKVDAASVAAGYGTRDDSKVGHGNSGTPTLSSGGNSATVSGSPREPTRTSGAAGYSRDEVRPPRVIPKESGLPRGTEESIRAGAGIHRDVHGSVVSDFPMDGDHRDAVASQQSSNPQYDASRGSTRVSDRGAPVPDRNAQENTRGHSREDSNPVYMRKDPAVGSGVTSQASYSGSGREDIRSPIAANSRDAVVTPARNSMAGHDRGTVIENPRVDDFVNSGITTAAKQGNVYDNTRDVMEGYSRETVVDNVHSNSRRTAVDQSRGTTVDHTIETSVGHSRGTVIEHPREPALGYSRETVRDNPRDVEVPHKETQVVHHREPATSSSWDPHEISDEKSDRDSELTRPQEYPPGGGVEEPIYTSEGSEVLGSTFSFDKDDYDEDIAVDYSSSSLPRTQKPRQVMATPQIRRARGPHPASPCPSVFSYEGTRAGKERWYGVVLVSTDETLTGLRIEIQLDKRADLLGTWLGEVSSVDNVQYTIWNGRRRVYPGPPLSVKIFVKYNEHESEPPRVKTIRINGRQICPKEKGKPNAKPPQPPRLPPNRPTQQGNKPVNRPTKPANSAAQNPNRPQGNKRPQQKPVNSGTTGQSTEQTELVDGVACGRIEVQPSPLITYGQRTARGQWPWHAAIYQSKGTDLSYICGGSLIGKRAILTAAHCVSRRYIDRPVDPESLVVYLGKYHLKLWSEGGVQDKQVLEVHVHPEYNSTDFQADIAILILSSPVEFTIYVKPICLWDRHRPSLSEVEGHEGVVVGWGYDERGMVTEDLMMAKMPIVSQQTCIWSYPQFFSHFTSNRTYCAGFRNGTSVCNGDSGGGMVFPKTTGIRAQGQTITWALRGIVSLSASQANKRVCNTDHYVVFTDVVKFYDWMKKYH